MPKNAAQHILKLARSIEDVLRYQYEQWRYLYQEVLEPFWRKRMHLIKKYPRLLTISQTSYIPELQDVAYLYAMAVSEEEIFDEFYNSLPANTQKMMDYLVWHPIATEKEIIRDLGLPISDRDENATHLFRKKIKRDYLLFGVYASFNWESRGNEFQLYIPHELRLHLINYYEKPTHYYLQPVSEPLAGVTSLSLEGQILAELPSISLYHQQGKIKCGKSGKPNANTYNSMRKSLGLQEFYPQDNKLLQALRTSLIANLWASLNPKTKQLKLSGAELLKHLFEQHYFSGKFNHSYLLLHLKGTTRIHSYHINRLDLLYREMAREMQVGKWLSMENLFYWIYYRGYYNAAFDQGEAIQYAAYSSAWGNEPVTRSNYDRMVEWPSLKASFFLFGAFGLFDLAYTQPDTSRPGETCFTPFDGLQYVRLNALGAYVFGLSDTYQPVIVSREDIYQLSTDKLLIRLSEAASPADANRLLNFATPLGNNRYRVSNESFLKNCRDLQDLESQIQLFRQLVQQRPPRNWEAFFEQIKKRVEPLSLVQGVRVYQIPASSELPGLIATDEKLKKLVWKAENYQIIIREKDVDKFKNRLKKFGYLI
ncbi:MAG: hypothetical protein D6730_24230 [Bacteroidetes bacterium]|nr:MAG: hypothetical protein D6730_24230 [Bacteroidota bacterium]